MVHVGVDQATKGSVILLCGQLLFAACAPPAAIAPAQADADQWERHKGACEQILTAPSSYPTDDLARCTRVWESHRQVGDLSIDLRSLYAVAFSQLYYQARDEYDREIATTALARLCIPRHPLDDDGHVEEVVPQTLQCGVIEATATAADDARTPWDRVRARLEPTRATISHEGDAKLSRAARKILSEANKAAAEQRHGAAAELYAEILEDHPGHLGTRYGLAVSLAALGEDARAVTELERIYATDSLESRDHLRAARTELAFAHLRDDLAFKVLTGYRRIIVANSAAELGRDSTLRLADALAQRGIDAPPPVEDRHLRMHPVVFARPGLEPEIESLIDELGLRDARLTTLDFEAGGDPDAIIIWGQPEVLDHLTPEGPERQGVPADTRRRDPLDILDPVDEAIDDANELRDRVPR